MPLSDDTTYDAVSEMQAPRHDAGACLQDPGGHNSVCLILESCAVDALC